MTLSLPTCVSNLHPYLKMEANNKNLEKIYTMSTKEFIYKSELYMQLSL